MPSDGNEAQKGKELGPKTPSAVDDGNWAILPCDEGMKLPAVAIVWKLVRRESSTPRLRHTEIKVNVQLAEPRGWKAMEGKPSTLSSTGADS